MRFKITFLAVLFFSIPSLQAQTKNKMDLDDINIKGELHQDNRLRLLAREKNTLKNFVKYRANYRAEMIEDLARALPKDPVRSLREPQN